MKRKGDFSAAACRPSVEMTEGDSRSGPGMTVRAVSGAGRAVLHREGGKTRTPGAGRAVLHLELVEWPQPEYTTSGSYCVESTAAAQPLSAAATGTDSPGLYTGAQDYRPVATLLVLEKGKGKRGQGTIGRVGVVRGARRSWQGVALPARARNGAGSGAPHDGVCLTTVTNDHGEFVKRRS